MDEDWHAICQVIRRGGVEGAEWENLYCKFVDTNKEIYVRSPDGSSRAQLHWKLSERRRVLRPSQRAADCQWRRGSAGAVEQAFAEPSLGID